VLFRSRKTGWTKPRKCSCV